MQKAIALSATFILVVLLYLPAANGPYLLDDYPNLVQNENLILEKFDLESIGNAVMSSNASFTGRPVSMLSFSLNYTLAGNKNPFSVKFTNILLHLITGVGVFILLKLLLRYWIPQQHCTNIFWTALIATALWLIHPLQVSTVLYAIQRMTILSALFTVFGLVAYIKFRELTISTNTKYKSLIVSISAFTTLGVLAKENAILLPMLALLIEVTVFRLVFHPDTTRFNQYLIKSFLFIPTIIIFAYLLFTYFSLRGEVIWPYAFTIDQRLLTEARVLIQYIGWIFLLNPAPMSLLHTDIELSTGLLSPVTTMLSAASLAGLIIAAFFSIYRQKIPVLGFGILWFFTGHLIESTTIPLELVFEHRNYLPSLGFLLIAAYVLVHRLETSHGNRSRRIFFCTLVLLTTTYLCHERARSWSDDKSYLIDLINTKGNVSWTWAEVANYLDQTGNYGYAVASIRTAARLDPTEPAFIFGEARFRCKYQPETAFTEDFRTELISTLANKPLTPTSINAFVSMIRTCRRTTANDTIFRTLYTDASTHDMNIMADIGRRALADLNANSSHN